MTTLYTRLLVAVVFAILAASDIFATELVTISRPAPRWSLLDYRGHQWESSSLYSSKATVVVFLGTECPLAKTYAIRLEAIAKEYEGKDVGLIGVNSNAQDSLLEISSFASRHSITFPIVKDPDAKLAEQFQALRTPEAFVIDRKGIIRYQGRIDDQYGIGYAKPEPTETGLKLAVDAILEDRPVELDNTEVVGCLIGKARHAKLETDAVKGQAQVTFCRDIAPILQKHCTSCHRDGQIGPMVLDNFEDAAAWAEMICEVVGDGRMPPWHADPKFGHFANDRTMSSQHKEILVRWLEQGTPKGDEADLPKPIVYAEGWQLPREPDLILNMRDKPFTVPATGVVDYQYFASDSGLTEDKWIQAFEIQPGNRSVVHHILVFAQDPKGKKELHGERGYLAGYVPGTRVIPFPKGMAKKIEAGSRIIFQVHYTPIGTAQQDTSRIGIVFANEDEVTHEVNTFSAVQPQLRIPPREPSYKSIAKMREELPECQLLSMSPHMHVRGKSFEYEAVYPNGKTEKLLNVPSYDFGWQTAYTLADKKMLPKGTRIRCTATFDNSEKNLNNPDPSKWVSWGDQTTDEMMIGYFDYAISRSNDSGE